MSLPTRDGVNGRYYLIHKLGTDSEKGGSKVIKAAPDELIEKYQQVFT